MASIGPVGNLIADIAPRRKRPPRKLNYLKCTFCRKAKVKCLPSHRAEAEEKCLRCHHKHLACSGPQRKQSSHQAPIQSETVLSRTIAPSVDVTLQEHEERDLLALLSLHHILDLAATELVAIGKQMLKPLEGDRSWTRHIAILDDCLDDCNDLLEVFREKLKHAQSAVAQVILAATMEISYPPRLSNVTEAVSEKYKDAIMAYERNYHYGIAYILQMQLLQHKENPTNKDVEDMVQLRSCFIDSIPSVLERQHIEDWLPVHIEETQLFVPKSLFRIPAVVRAIEEDGRKDLLGRPIGHILYDNEVDAKFRLNSYEDDEDDRDVLGRSRLHIACALGADKQHPPDLTSLPTFQWIYCSALGLNAFHIAALHGRTHIFRAAAAKGLDGSFFGLRYQHSYYGRNFLHCAACLGHLELVDYFIELHEGYHDRSTLIKVFDDPDWWGNTPLHLAAQNGHVDVVRALLPHTDWTAMRTHSRHSLFSAAITGRHLEIMKLLQSFCPFDEVYEEDEEEETLLTPLAEASRQGFVEGVQYLLSLEGEGVELNSINEWWNEATEEVVLKTPLDLAIEGEHTECVTMLRDCGALTWREIDLVQGDDEYGMEG